jgi:glycine dehydrogenase subunit 2
MKRETPIITAVKATGEPTVHFGPPDAEGPGPAELIPAAHRRRTPPALPWLDEWALRAHFADLAGRVPSPGTGSALTQRAEALPGLLRFHPGQPAATVQGLLELAHAAARALAALTGLDRFTLQPLTLEAAERAGLMVVRAYWAREGQVRHELVAPAGSTALAAAEGLGFTPRPVPRTPQGDMDLDALLSVVGASTAAVVLSWLTPDGAFERHLASAGKVADSYGALVCVDARGLGALAGRTRLRETGVHAAWLPLAELCPTASSAALGVASPLTEFLPRPLIGKAREGCELDDELPRSVGRLALPPANALDALALYVQVSLLGEVGLRARGADLAVDANVLALSRHAQYPEEQRRPVLR